MKVLSILLHLLRVCNATLVSFAVLDCIGLTVTIYAKGDLNLIESRSIKCIDFALERGSPL